MEAGEALAVAKMSEMKKASYYVLFLGAKESKGLRGPHYIEPVLQYFVSQESRMQALKVTLQVSSKGLKIIPVNHRAPTVDNNQTERHFIPHHAITCVFQAPPPNDDIVSCILLIYNPDTKCPVHVHCYRCDSPETATVLKTQLETLVNREENQRKFRDIEGRLQSKGLLQSQSPTKQDRGTPEFDCRKSDSSEASDRGFSSGSGASNVPSERMATLYDSLAAELREKLSARKRNTPILFPPRDYDTMHRQRGNLNGIDLRRCSNPAVVGAAAMHKNRRSYASREQDSCGRSSGIGSAEDNCSPVHDPLLENHALPSSSDDEDWNPSSLVATESTQFLVRPTWVAASSSSKPVGIVRSHHPPPRSSSSPVPPPLPKRPELRQRSPEASTPPPPLPVFSREKFEGVRQKWEKLDHQYVKQRSHDSLDDGYRSREASREAAEADYRRQLSRESLLRSLSRSNKTGSKDSLDRWVEAGVRSRSMWRKLEDDPSLLCPPGEQPPRDLKNPVTSQGPSGHVTGRDLHGGYPSPNIMQHKSAGSGGMMGHRKLNSSSSSAMIQDSGLSKPHHNHSSHIISSSNNGRPSVPAKNPYYPSTSSSSHNNAISNSNSRLMMDPSRRREKNYRELEDQDRYPGLDKETARLVLHSSNLNLSQQHIYSEPNFEHCPSSSHQQSNQPAKSKKPFYAFWK